MTLSKASRVFGILSLTLMSCSFARHVAAEEGWLVSLKQAQEQAAKEGKAIFMEFTGSDWCPPCKALHSNVLTKDVFKTEMAKHFVLLKLDNPNDKSHQSEEEQAQYKELSKKYKIQGVPTVLLTDVQGRPFAQQVGYSGAAAEEFVKDMVGRLDAGKKISEAFAKANEASGAERARLLDEALSLVGSDVAVNFYEQEVKQILELDADNQLGLKSKYGLVRAVAELKQSSPGQPGALEKIDNLISEYNAQGEQLQELMLLKASVQFSKDKDLARQTLEAAVKVNPESKMGKDIQSILDRVFGSQENK